MANECRSSHFRMCQMKPFQHVFVCQHVRICVSAILAENVIVTFISKISTANAYWYILMTNKVFFLFFFFAHNIFSLEKGK